MADEQQHSTPPYDTLGNIAADGTVIPAQTFVLPTRQRAIDLLSQARAELVDDNSECTAACTFVDAAIQLLKQKAEA